MYQVFEGIVIYSDSVESIDELWVERAVNSLHDYLEKESGVLDVYKVIPLTLRLILDSTSLKANSDGQYVINSKFVLPGGEAYRVKVIGYEPDSKIDWRIDDFPYEKFQSIVSEYISKKLISGVLSYPEVHIDIELKTVLSKTEEKDLLKVFQDYAKSNQIYCSDEFLPNEKLKKGIHLDNIKESMDVTSFLKTIALDEGWRVKVKKIVVG